MDDRAPLKDSRFTERLFGKLFADRGYISQDLFEMLFVDDIPRHRSIENFATNLFAGLIAYNLLPKKPAMNLEIIDRGRLIA